MNKQNKKQTLEIKRMFSRLNPLVLACLMGVLNLMSVVDRKPALICMGGLVVAEIINFILLN